VSGFYTVTVGPAAPTVPPTYTITATPIAGKEQVKDGILEVKSNGAKNRTVGATVYPW
jgi:hypothetical protein